MSRPTIYGKELRINNQNKCIGINLGYNFYSEHEDDTLNIVQSCNNNDLLTIKMIQSLAPIKYMKEISKLKKQRKINEKIISRWNNTPFKDYVFMPNVNSILRMIVIDNSDVRKKYNTVLLDDGHYYMLSIGNSITTETWEKRFGKKKTMSEEDIFYMPDYQGLCRNTGYIINNGYNLTSRRNFGASWASHLDNLIIVLPAEQKSYLEDIQSALKAGALACVYQESRMFKDRGCCLINLDAFHFGTK